MIFPKALKERIVRRQCVAFIGAGFSIPCGMPVWHNLLLMLLEDAKVFQSSREHERNLSYCARAIEEGQYSLAAGILRESLPINDLDEAIRKKYSMDVFFKSDEETKARMNDRMKNLISAPWAGILTTNYDELIEYAIGRYNSREVFQTYGNDPMLGSVLCSPSPTGFFFVKLHGSIVGGNYVLGTEEYDRTYINTPQVTSFLSALMLRYHVIFIGCSLEDEILRIRRKLCFDFSSRIPTAYALLPDKESNVARKGWLRANAQVEPLLYEEKVDAYPRHYEVNMFLKEAADCTDPITDVDVNDNITWELRKLSLQERIENIGTVNRGLLEVISNAGIDHTVRHIQLVNPSLLNLDASNQLILNISPEERIYRILFLESVGLVEAEKSVDGSHSYRIPKEVVSMLRSQ